MVSCRGRARIFKGYPPLFWNSKFGCIWIVGLFKEACLLLNDASVSANQRVLQPGEGVHSQFISQVSRRPTTESFSLHRRLILGLLWPRTSGGALNAVYGRGVHHVIVGSLGQ